MHRSRERVIAFRRIHYHTNLTLPFLSFVAYVYAHTGVKEKKVPINFSSLQSTMRIVSSLCYLAAVMLPATWAVGGEEPDDDVSSQSVGVYANTPYWTYSPVRMLLQTSLPLSLSGSSLTLLSSPSLVQHTPYTCGYRASSTARQFWQRK